VKRPSLVEKQVIIKLITTVVNYFPRVETLSYTGCENNIPQQQA
jgi:hypothetical protein